MVGLDIQISSPVSNLAFFFCIFKKSSGYFSSSLKNSLLRSVAHFLVGSFVFLIVVFWFFWCIPNINLVLDVYLAKSSLCGLLHLIVFFMGQKFLVLWGHNCWFFGYNSWAKETLFKRLFSSHILYRELHMFYFRYLIVSGFRLVSLIYWKLIFVGNNRYSSKFIALHVKGTEQWIFHFPSNTCWRCLLSHCVCFKNFLSNVSWLTLCSYWHYPLLLIYMFGNFYIGSTRLVL